MLKYLHIVVVLGLGVYFAGCSSTKLEPGAEKVRLTNQEPQGCEYLGEIAGSQGNAITGAYTSNDNLAEGARNDLKNKGLAKGANVIHVLASRDGMTIGQYGGSKSSSNMEGVAYRCPEKKTTTK